MQYKSITLELIQSRQSLHSWLKSRKLVLPMLDQYAVTLRNQHLEWIEQLRESRPELDDMSLRNAALELAVQELETHFNTLEEQAETFDLDDAVAFLRRNTPTG